MIENSNCACSRGIDIYDSKLIDFCGSKLNCHSIGTLQVWNIIFDTNQVGDPLKASLIFMGQI